MFLIKKPICFGFLLLVWGCADQVTSSDNSAPSARPLGSQPNPLRALPAAEPSFPTQEAQGIQIAVITPENQRSWYRLEPQVSRKVPSKTFPLNQFTRTLENTHLKLQVTVPADLRAASTQMTLYSGGEKIVSASLSPQGKEGNRQVELSIKTPELSDEERKAGFAKVTYELFIDHPSGRSHLPFSFLIFDESVPSLVVPKNTEECLVYHPPQRASGCYQNRTRSTQEVVFNDSLLQHHEVDVQFSGSLGITWSVVTAQLGGQITVANGTDVSRGSEIHFTNCIECASVIYRQEVEAQKSGNVYQVMADGSTLWMGSAVMKSSAFAYEFASTGSESKNYSCDILSQLPVGSTPACNTN